MIACESSSSSTITYDVTDATIYHFYFAEDDSFPGLGNAEFIVEDRADTGLIYMADKDSIQYGTPLNSVRPKIVFNSVPAAAIYYIGDTSYIMSGTDTLDFTQSPIYIRVYANDRVHEKWYRIEPRVHQIDPYLYKWETLNKQICSGNAEQHVLIKKGEFFLYRNNGTINQLYTSMDGRSWTSQTITGLPTNTHPRRMVWDETSGLFWYADSTGIYTSPDGMSYTINTTIPLPNQCQMISLILSFDKHVWGIMHHKDTQKKELVYMHTNSSDKLTICGEVDEHFPISDFAATSFLSTSSLVHAIVAGGYDEHGKMQKDIYSIEKYDSTYRVSTIHHSKTFAGAAMVQYGDKILWIGGRQEDGTIIEDVTYSTNEGLTWQVADTAWHILPEGFDARQRISVLTYKNNLYIIGGQSSTQCHSDAYKGRMNSIDW